MKLFPLRLLSNLSHFKHFTLRISFLKLFFSILPSLKLRLLRPILQHTGSTITLGLCPLLLLLLSTPGCRPTSSPPLRIATAANAQFAMKALIDTFTLQYKIPCQMIIGSSGKLTAQIREGAPFDLFISADMKYPSELYKAGFAKKAPQVYAYGSLVIWSMNDRWNIQKKGIHKLQPLLDPSIKHIAIANPLFAPYGIAAKQALQNAGIFHEIEPKLVFGESISQTNQFILSQTADIGFTASSVVLAPTLFHKGYWFELPPECYSPIQQGALLLHHDSQDSSLTEQAQIFYRFLFSPTAKRILQTYGYTIHQQSLP